MLIRIINYSIAPIYFIDLSRNNLRSLRTQRLSAFINFDLLNSGSLQIWSRMRNFHKSDFITRRDQDSSVNWGLKLVLISIAMQLFNTWGRSESPSIFAQLIVVVVIQVNRAKMIANSRNMLNTTTYCLISKLSRLVVSLELKFFLTRARFNTTPN